jgi:hypothetical protein
MITTQSTPATDATVAQITPGYHRRGRRQSAVMELRVALNTTCGCKGIRFSSVAPVQVRGVTCAANLLGPRTIRSRGCRRLLCVGCARWGAWRSAPTRARRGRLAPIPRALRTRCLLSDRGRQTRMEASRFSVDATFRGPLIYASSTHRRHALAPRATCGC